MWVSFHGNGRSAGAPKEKTCALPIVTFLVPAVIFDLPQRIRLFPMFRLPRPPRRLAWATRVLWWEPLWIALLAPSLLLPGRFWLVDWHPFLMALLFLFWPLRLVVTGQLLCATPLTWPVLLLLAQTVGALVVTGAAPRAWESGGYLLFGVALYGALLNWRPLRAQPARLRWLLLAVGLGLAIAGALLIQPPLVVLELPVAMYVGETVNPNVLAGALLVPALVALGLALSPRWREEGQTSRRLLWTLAALLMIAVILGTGSRGALAGLAAGAVVFMWLRWPRTRYLAPLLVVAAAIAMATTSLVLLADTVSRGDPAQIDLSARPAIWEVTAAAIYADPWQGVGLGLYPDAPSVQLPLQPAMDMRIPHAHNLLLQVGADLGLAGLVTYLALLITATAMCARIVGRRPAGVGLAAVTLARRGQRWALGAGATAALAAILAHGVVDAVLWGTKLAFVPWLLLALIAHLFQDTYTRRRVKHRREAPS